MARPTGEALARLKAYRVEVLRRECFTEAEIRVYVDRRISSHGMLKIRRERSKEIRGLNIDEKNEWIEQHEESYSEQKAIDDLRRVSPEKKDFK